MIKSGRFIVDVPYILQNSTSVREDARNTCLAAIWQHTPPFLIPPSIMYCVLTEASLYFARYILASCPIYLLQEYNFACGSVWVRNVASDT
jgi:hypothetical protein